MRRLPPRPALALGAGVFALGVGLLGCTLVLAPLPAGECRVDEDCRALFLAAGGCGDYRCDLETHRCDVYGADADGDHYHGAPCGRDCDDSDPEIHPDAEERPNGVDDDCDGFFGPEEDFDGDGEPPVALGGLDCDDADGQRNAQSGNCCLPGAAGPGRAACTQPLGPIRRLAYKDVVDLGGTCSTMSTLGSDLRLRISRRDEMWVWAPMGCSYQLEEAPILPGGLVGDLPEDTFGVLGRVDTEGRWTGVIPFRTASVGSTGRVEIAVRGDDERQVIAFGDHDGALRHLPIESFQSGACPTGSSQRAGYFLSAFDWSGVPRETYQAENARPDRHTLDVAATDEGAICLLRLASEMLPYGDFSGPCESLPQASYRVTCVDPRGIVKSWSIGETPTWQGGGLAFSPRGTLRLALHFDQEETIPCLSEPRSGSWLLELELDGTCLSAIPIQTETPAVTLDDWGPRILQRGNQTYLVGVLTGRGSTLFGELGLPDRARRALYVLRLNEDEPGRSRWAISLGEAGLDTVVEDLAIGPDGDLYLLGQAPEELRIAPFGLIPAGSVLLRLDAGTGELRALVGLPRAMSPHALTVDSFGGVHVLGTAAESFYAAGRRHEQRVPGEQELVLLKLGP